MMAAVPRVTNADQFGLRRLAADPYMGENKKGEEELKFPQAPVSVAHVAAGASNLISIYSHIPDAIIQSGARWFGNANAVANHIGNQPWSVISNRQIGGYHTSGVISSISPNSDWDAQNIPALSTLRSFGKPEWDAISKIALTPMSKERRAEANEALRHNGGPLEGTGIQASATQLHNARRIIEGEDPLDVLRGPKTDAFGWNIHTSGLAVPHPRRLVVPVTIDGRQHDMIVDRMQGWGVPRGLTSLQPGKDWAPDDPRRLPVRPSGRYLAMEAAVRAATTHIMGGQQFGSRLGPLHRFAGSVQSAKARENYERTMDLTKGIAPPQLQAITWEFGKLAEQLRVSGTGTSYAKKGPPRSGQPYPYHFRLGLPELPLPNR